MRLIYLSWLESRNTLLRNNQHLSLDTLKKSLEAEKWRWRMVYSLARLGERHHALKEVIATVQSFIVNPVGESERGGIELLGVLSRWCELLIQTSDRRQGGRDDHKNKI